MKVSNLINKYEQLAIDKFDRYDRIQLATKNLSNTIPIDIRRNIVKYCFDHGTIPDENRMEFKEVPNLDDVIESIVKYHSDKDLI
jgi:hypothetical protein